MKLSLPSFDKAQVLVVGDVMLDRYFHGETSRISPEAPVPVVKVERTEDRAGGAGNVALNLAALGAGATLVGIVGADENAEVLKNRLVAARVHANFVISQQAGTITKLRVVSRHQQLLRMDFEDEFSAEDANTLTQKVLALLDELHDDKTGNKIGAVILSDYAKGTLPNPQLIIKSARAKNIPVFVDPKGNDFSPYAGATLLTPNLHEFEAIVGPCASEQEFIEKGATLLQEHNLDALLVTRGEHGMTLLRENESELHLPARAIEVFDVTGAGDTVISVLASAVAAGEDLPQAMALANLAAGIVVGKLGTATISSPELDRAIKSERGSKRGVVTEEQLLIDLEEARKSDEKIVFTNGCFDLLHAGHVGYLEEARKLGDRLVVAINSDASVERLKGKGRPIQSVENRMTVLSKLEAVDWVIFFEEDTPEGLLESLKPEIVVKGGDYTMDEVVGSKIVQAYGGEVKVLSFLDDCSTTAIVEKIRKQDR